ncbi:MAG: hypothetical protein ACE5HI_11015 [bacterium]
MKTNEMARLFTFYGVFLILCGIVAVVAIGMKAKTALISGGSMGVIALMIGYFMNHQKKWAFVAGLFQTIGLVGVFAWRGSLSFFSIIEILQNKTSGDPTSKSLAFMIIGTMFIVSLVVTALQITYFKSNLNDD